MHPLTCNSSKDDLVDNENLRARKGNDILMSVNGDSSRYAPRHPNM